MTEMQREVLAYEPTARIVRQTHCDPDTRFVIAAGYFRHLGWGCNRVQAWRAAQRLVRAGKQKANDIVVTYNG